MINKFLKAKHWQLFALLFGLPLLGQVFFMYQIISSTMTENDPDIGGIFSVLSVFPILMLIVGGVFYGWIWSISIGLGNSLREELKINNRWFKTSFFYLIGYLVLFMLFFMYMFIGIQGSLAVDVDVAPTYFVIIFPLHMIAMVCSFYILYFAAKVFKTAEFRRSVSFSDFAGEFFLLWFFFIGVWIIQPKVNRLVEEEQEVEELV